MNVGMAEKISKAVLYEGYMLYPYRPSALKNQQRWNFGTLFPAEFDQVRRGTERSSMHVECVLQSHADSQVAIQARFLQLGAGESEQNWDEAVERVAELAANLRDPFSRMTFRFEGNTGGINGSVRFSFARVGEEVYKLFIDLMNESSADPAATREQVLSWSLISAHMILNVESGSFSSLIDPPDDLRQLAGGCRNVGCFPVLVGEPGQHDTLLCSPIILYDYPQIAPESAGNFFDATEIDEMLTLRVMTLTDEEKDEMRSADDRVRSLLERTQQSAREQLMRTHGTIRSMRPANDHE
jgi:hypothetical protein